MGNLAKLRRLSNAERFHLVISAALLGLFVIAVRVLPFAAVARMQSPVAYTRRTADPAVRMRIGWAVRTTANYVPAATCLPQALAARALLRWYGEPAVLRVGVAKTDEGKLEAHAWVECQEQIIIGGFPALGRYTPFPDIDS